MGNKQKIPTESFDRLAQRQGSKYLSKITKPNPAQYQNKKDKTIGDAEDIENIIDRFNLLKKYAMQFIESKKINDVEGGFENIKGVKDVYFPVDTGFFEPSSEIIFEVWLKQPSKPSEYSDEFYNDTIYVECEEFEDFIELNPIKE